jgi:hypothetical protein
MIITGKYRSARRKTCASLTLSTTNLTRTGLVSKTGLRGDRPANNRHRHSKDNGMAQFAETYYENKV